MISNAAAGIPPGFWPDEVADQFEAARRIEPAVSDGILGDPPRFRLDNLRRPPLRLSTRLQGIETHAPFDAVMLASGAVDPRPLIESWRASPPAGRLLVLLTEGAPLAGLAAANGVHGLDIGDAIVDDPVPRRALCNWLRWVECRLLIVAGSVWGAKLAREYRRPLRECLRSAAWLQDGDEGGDYDLFLVDREADAPTWRAKLGDAARIEALRDEQDRPRRLAFLDGSPA